MPTAQVSQDILSMVTTLTAYLDALSLVLGTTCQESSGSSRMHTSRGISVALKN